MSRHLSLLAACFRLVHAAVYGAGLLTLFMVLTLVGDAGGVAALGAGGAHALVSLRLAAHGDGYSIGLVFFGVHCPVLGYLVARSGFLPRILGALLLLAGLGYLTDSFARTLLTDYAAYEAVLAAVVFVPALVGELSLGVWLVSRGVGVPRDSVAGSV